MARHNVNTVAVLTWAFLVCATLGTWLIVERHHLSVAWAVSLVMLIAAIKGRMIVLHYMELKHAPFAWRIAFELWVVGVAILILGLWFLAAT